MISKLFNWIKSFFRKKIGLPLWFLILGRPVEYKDFEQYSNTLDKIIDSLDKDMIVVIKLNDEPYLIYRENGKIEITKLTDKECKILL